MIKLQLDITGSMPVTIARLKIVDKYVLRQGDNVIEIPAENYEEFKRILAML